MKMNEEEEKKPNSSRFGLPCEDLSVHSTRGIPLHTRYTKLNKIQIKTFRDLLMNQVLNKLNIRLDNDVISIVVLYTFERTHAFTPQVRDGERRSLTRDQDILKVLEPLNSNQDPNPTDDYELKELVGRTLYGFDIHDSPYNEFNDPNPCEIMTDKGGIFLVPIKMSNWFLNQDGSCIALPVRYRFKHMITDATVKSRGTGPYLELIIKPIKGVVPGTDNLLKQFESNVTLCDLESAFSFSEIDSNLRLPTHAEPDLIVDDPLAKEIAKSYRSTRESVLVVVQQSPVWNNMPNGSENQIEEPIALDKPFPAEEGKRERLSDWKPKVSLVIESMSGAVISPSSPVDETGSQLDSEDEKLREHLLNGPSIVHKHSEAPMPRLLPLKRNLSLVAHSEATQSVLEIGAGIIETGKSSRSLLYNRMTPNPLAKDISVGLNFS